MKKKKKISTINSVGRKSSDLLSLYEILLKPYLKAVAETGKSQTRLLDDFFHTDTRKFFHMRVLEAFSLPGVRIKGNRKIPGVLEGRELSKGDIIVVRRDDSLDRIEVGQLAYNTAEDYIFEISLAELKFCMDRCEYV